MSKKVNEGVIIKPCRGGW